jgi:negative regulator of genetic competence, sporulation and motility
VRLQESDDESGEDFTEAIDKMTKGRADDDDEDDEEEEEEKPKPKKKAPAKKAPAKKKKVCFIFSIAIFRNVLTSLYRMRMRMRKQSTKKKPGRRER